MVFNMIDDKLTFPMKRLRLVKLFNGVDVTQTANYHVAGKWVERYLLVLQRLDTSTLKMADHFTNHL